MATNTTRNVRAIVERSATVREHAKPTMLYVSDGHGKMLPVYYQAPKLSEAEIARAEAAYRRELSVNRMMTDQKHKARAIA